MREQRTGISDFTIHAFRAGMIVKATDTYMMRCYISAGPGRQTIYRLTDPV